MRAICGWRWPSSVSRPPDIRLFRPRFIRFPRTCFPSRQWPRWWASAAPQARLAACSLRFVLGDDLTRACPELAFAGGARLIGCLDLLRMPAPHMWLEWNDEAHKRVIQETRAAPAYDPAAKGRKVGVLLRASVNG